MLAVVHGVATPDVRHVPARIWGTARARPAEPTARNTACGSVSHRMAKATITRTSSATMPVFHILEQETDSSDSVPRRHWNTLARTEETRASITPTSGSIEGTKVGTPVATIAMVLTVQKTSFPVAGHFRKDFMSAGRGAPELVDRDRWRWRSGRSFTMGDVKSRYRARRVVVAEEVQGRRAWTTLMGLYGWLKRKDC